ncbi:cupin domain-containing protein [Rhizobium mayense]|uniref:cupin domain-containing protein n=1 Tax=Rhizobium mayense TaxID=1312184 RepID=UPI00398C6C7C
METKLAHLSDLPVTTGLPGVADADARLSGKHEIRLAKAVGITQFGVNLVTLDPGGMSSSRHWHMAEDEFLYILTGTPTLVDENGQHILGPGDVVGFPAGQPNAHHLLNHSAAAVTMIVVGSRKPGEETIYYPDDHFGPIRK